MEEEALKSRLRGARVGRLATIDEKGRPHVVPVCFVYDGRAVYTPVDAKPKGVEGEKLARVRHIRARPRRVGAALLVDHYEETWWRLWWILVRGRATVVTSAEEKEHAAAMERLRNKYLQYGSGWLPAEATLIRIEAEKVTAWESGLTPAGE